MKYILFHLQNNLQVQEKDLLQRLLQSQELDATQLSAELTQALMDDRKSDWLLGLKLTLKGYQR